jgi:O-antigen ligase
MTAWADTLPGARTWAQRPPIVPSREAPAQPASEPAPPSSPLVGIQWSPVYAAFLIYIFVITTYRLNLGNLAMVAALGGLLFQRQLRLPPLLLWLGLFLIWAATGYVTTKYPDVVWEQLVGWGKLWLIALVAANALRSRAQIRFFTIVFLGSFALYPLRGALFNYYLYNSAVHGRAIWNFIYSNPNDLAALTLLQVSMVAGLLVTEAKGWIRTAALVGAGFLPFLILLTQSRGAFIGLCVFTLFALFGSGAHGSGRSKFMKRVVGLILVGAIVVLAAPTGVWERVRGLRSVSDTHRLEAVDSEGSARQRFEIWKVAARVISDNPISGVGLGAYRRTHEFYVQRGGFDPTARGRKDTHSTLLSITAETGFPGLILFVTLVLTPLVRADKMRRRCRMTLPRTSRQLFFLEVGLLAYFVAGIFGSFAHLSFLYLHLMLLWVVAEAGYHDWAKIAGVWRRPRRGR